jgi:hypothetical protein
VSYQTDRYDEYDAMNRSGTEPQWAAMSLLSTDVLLAAAQGKLDLAVVARTLLAARGIGGSGRWEGFTTAREYWRTAPHPGYAALARSAGKTPSDRRVEAARKNGKLGGRPRKKP